MDLTLFCWILTVSNYSFSIDIGKGRTVDHLKDMIKEKRQRALGAMDTDDLEVWKLTHPILSVEIGMKLENVQKPQEISGCIKLDAADKLSKHFSSVPDEHVHVIVFCRPPITRNSSNGSNHLKFVPIFKHWSRRKATVQSLFDILIRERVVHVRGTPGCGKTTLMNLLHAFIVKQDPSAFVYVQTTWPSGKSDLPLEERLRLVDPAFPRCDGELAYLLFDEGQESYEDRPLWNDFFKRVCDGGYPLYRVVLFCSYGSPSSRPVPHRAGTPPTPVVLRDAARISLWPRNGVERSIGILLDRSEFNDVVLRFGRQMNLHPDLLDLIFAWTVGHVGAVVGMLEMLSYQRVAATRHQNEFTVENFYDENPIHQLAQSLSGGAFGRGLPDDLTSHPDVAALFRELLREGTIEAKPEEAENENEAIRMCHSSGWIHSDQDKGATRYAFPSPLHAACVSWRLSPTNEMPNFTLLFDLTLDVISKFKPSQLRLPIRRVGHSSAENLPEAQYQDEFYRSLFSVTFGNVRVSPEFASARRALVAGRIDFFIPVKKWGVEITRDGGKLTESSSRFAEPGAYGAWLKSGDMADYILLDCRTSIPRKARPDIPNLFHVVFQDDYQKVVVFNNRLVRVKGPIALLENHH